MKPLTDRQKEILGYMVSHARLRYPTVRQIAKHFGLWPATVQDHIAALRRKGCIPEQSEKIPLDLEVPNSVTTKNA